MRRFIMLFAVMCLMSGCAFFVPEKVKMTEEAMLADVVQYNQQVIAGTATFDEAKSILYHLEETMKAHVSFFRFNKPE